MGSIGVFLKKAKIFLRDNFHLLFKSAAENHLRIQKIQKELRGEMTEGRKAERRVNETLAERFGKISRGEDSIICHPGLAVPASGGITGSMDSGSEAGMTSNAEAVVTIKEEFIDNFANLEISNLNFESFTHLKNYQRKLRYAFSSSTTLIIVLAAIITFQIFGHGSKGATFGWVQTNWNGGADTVNFPNHNNDKTGWTKYFSKDSAVDVTTTAGEATIASTTETSAQSSDTDFANWTKDNNAYISGTGSAASLTMLKPAGATCSAAAECFSGLCSGTPNVCQEYWKSGPCAGINVAASIFSGYAWKTTNTSCVTPQCDHTETYSGTYNTLSLSSSVDFSEYPAQNACKARGGRLPTMTELKCIFNNVAAYGITIGYYISASEYSATQYWFANYSTNGSFYASQGDKTYYGNRFIQCVSSQ